jgi:hypothetical protein
MPSSCTEMSLTGSSRFEYSLVRGTTTLLAVKFFIERRLKANGVRLKSLRQELAELSEQREQLADEADDHRLRAIMSDSPMDALEAKESGRHADAFGRRRADIVDEIAKLEAQQDRLLDDLSAANREK